MANLSGAGGRSRTDTLSPELDFESSASTSSATPAAGHYVAAMGADGQSDREAGAGQSPARASRGPQNRRRSIGLWQLQHLLGDVAQDELARDRRDARDHHLAQQPLHVEFLGVTHAAVGKDRRLAGGKAGLCSKVLGGVG